LEVQADVLASTGTINPPGMTAEEILEAHEQALQLAESTGLLRVASRAHNNLGNVKIARLGHVQAGREHHRRAAELGRRHGDVGGEIQCLTGEVSASILLGDLKAAGATLSRTRQLLSELGEAGLATRWVRRVEMILREIQGEWSEAARQARVLQAEARERGDLWILPSAAHVLARVCLESYALGGEVEEVDEAEAEAALAEVIELLDRDPYLTGVAPYVYLGRLRIYQGRFDDARRILAEAQEKARSQSVSSAWDELDLLWLQGCVGAAEERWPQALTAFEDLAGLCASRGLHWDWARTLLDWSETHAARGEPGDVERARVLLQDAAAAFAEMPAPAYTAAAQARLAALAAA
jgi:ATP/maltotriose-dependent transcriptional regulator MalT